MFIKPYAFFLEKRDNVSGTYAHLIRSRIYKKYEENEKGSVEIMLSRNELQKHA